MAFFVSIGSIRCLARPFPEPHGIIPMAVSDCMRALPTSFMVPSPPMATTMSACSSFAFSAIFVACPAYCVHWIVYENLSLSRYFSTSLGIPAFFTVPEIGFMMNTIFFLVAIVAKVIKSHIKTITKGLFFAFEAYFL